MPEDLAALLERLKQCDPATYQEILHFELAGYHRPRNQCLDHLQCGVQRVIAAHSWHLLQSQDVDDGQYYAEISEIAPGYDGDCWNERHLSLMAEGKGPSACHALVAAYIACLEARP